MAFNASDTGLDLSQFKHYVALPALDLLSRWGLNTASGLVLTVGTCVAESMLRYKVQLGGGPARGLGQMEQATYDDTLARYIHLHHYDLWSSLQYSCMDTSFNGLVHDDKWACIMTRLRYMEDPVALPDPDDAEGMAKYHKRVYNTSLGKTEVNEDDIAMFRAAYEA